MKTSFFKYPLIGGIAFFCLMSCEKPDVCPSSDPSATETKEVQGRQVLSAHFDASQTEEEREEAWTKMVESYKAKKAASKTASVLMFYIRAVITTGTIENAATDGGVELRTNVSCVTYRPLMGDGWINFSVFAKLDNPGDDREGGNDYYLIEYDDPYDQNTRFKDLSIRQYYLGLKGTDGWYVTNTKVSVNASDHPGSTGNSIVNVPDNYWLDNTTSTAWDWFYSPTFLPSQSGTIYFQ